MTPGDKIINLSESQRVASVLGGGALILTAMKRRGFFGGVLAVLGSGLIMRGIRGYCPLCNSFDEPEADAAPGHNGEFSRSIPGHGGVLVEKRIVINRPRSELYAYWRKLENLPGIMEHLESVIELDEIKSNWVARAPGGGTVTWGAQIVRDEPDHYIAWRSTEGADIANSGSVRFLDAEAGTGTLLHVIFEYKAPGGKLGSLVARMMGEEPGLQVESDLQRFKERMESTSGL